MTPNSTVVSADPGTGESLGRHGFSCTVSGISPFALMIAGFVEARDPSSQTNRSSAAKKPRPQTGLQISMFTCREACPSDRQWHSESWPQSYPTCLRFPSFASPITLPATSLSVPFACCVERAARSNRIRSPGADYSTEQGIISAEQGILALEQGILPTKSEIIIG